METLELKKNTYKYACEKCDFYSNNKTLFNRHSKTIKHDQSQMETKKHIKTHFSCENCERGFKTKSGLWKHKKICQFTAKQTYDESNESNESNELTELISIEENLDYKGMFMKIINENSEMKTLLVEQQKQLGEQQKQIGELIPRIGNSTIKQKFNINVFLNEQCKDAITMNKFLDNIKITLEDLFITKQKGITEGVSNIFIKNMNKLSVYERPIHCTDVKRETVYIKSEGEDGESSQWEKDNEQGKLKKAINDMTYVQSKNLTLYTDENPDWMDKEHKQNEYTAMMMNCMDDIKKDNRQDKVVKKLCNNVYYNGEK